MLNSMILFSNLLILFTGKDAVAIQHWTERPKNGWKIFPGRGCGNLIPIKILDSMPQDTLSLTCALVRKPFLPKEPISMPFMINGLVTTSKGKKTKAFHNWGEKFRITFEIEVNQEFSTETWLNVFHMTIGGNMGKHGDRIPALFVNKAKFFHFTMSIGDKKNYVWNFNYQLKKAYSVEIMQKLVAGKYMYCIQIDGQSHCKENTTPRSFDFVQLYLSDPWYETFSKFGKLWNFSVFYL